MKKSLRILTVLSIAVSSILFATPSHAAASTQWAYVIAPNGVFVKSISGLSVGMSAQAFPAIAANVSSGNTAATISSIGSLTTISTMYGLGSTGGCDSFSSVGTTVYACVNFTVGDQGYVISLSSISFTQPQEVQIGFDGGVVGASTTAPGAPTSVTATSTGATTANVSFTAPTSDGGAAITSYTATSSPGGVTGSISQAGSGTIAMTGLTAGTAYTFTVKATNSVGDSAASSPSNSITTVGVPGAPTSLVATTTGKRSATVSFGAPSSNGGSVVTSYTATSTPGGITKTLTQATGGTFNFDGLQPGTA